jgi:RNA 2',3'-cyclic 3'-phosphodiesterase
MPAGDVERWRVFIAIEIPDAVLAALGGPLDALQPLTEWLRLNTADRIHLTLHFLGHLPVSEVDALPARLEPAVASHQPFSLTAAGVGAFPQLRRPQVLWAGIQGDGTARLTALQVDLGRKLKQAGLEAEERFHPHLTLARVRKPLRAEARRALDAWVRQWHDAMFGAFSVEAVRLMRSELGGGPARYTTLATFGLK